MRRGLVILMAAILALAGCARKSDKEQVEASLQDSKFFKALGAIPGASEGYTGHGGFFDGDTSWPIWAARTVKAPEVNYTINVARPFAEVDFTLAWPCTLTVIYTDVPDTSIRDTVVKPAPLINGTISARFEYVGEEWVLEGLSPCEAKFDSLADMIRIDSIQVKVRRGGQVVDYPTLDSMNRLPWNEYPYAFHAGDSVDLRLWETHAEPIDFAWSFLHGPPGHWCSPFQLDSTNSSFYGSWVINQQAEHEETRWVWFQVTDLNGSIIQKEMPDRAVLWGLVYIVE